MKQVKEEGIRHIEREHCNCAAGISDSESRGDLITDHSLLASQFHQRRPEPQRHGFDSQRGALAYDTISSTSENKTKQKQKQKQNAS